MTFTQRMTADVGAPQPRWEYLSRKLLEVLGLAFAIVLVTHRLTDWVAILLIAGGIHVLISQLLWWSRHPIDWWGDRGRGGVLGDTVYHGWIALMPWVVAYAFVHMHPARPAAAAVAAGWIFTWWVLDGAGFGVVRPG